MVELQIGRHGVVLLIFMFLLLGAEDILVWLNSGDLPAAEFFVGMLVVLGVILLAIREAIQHPPPPL
ncbi:MAG: hypothetical protein ABEJ23_05355 [Haloarculaceae archaeon]